MILENEKKEIGEKLLRVMQRVRSGERRGLKRRETTSRRDGTINRRWTAEFDSQSEALNKSISGVEARARAKEVPTEGKKRNKLEVGTDFFCLLDEVYSRFASRSSLFFFRSRRQREGMVSSLVTGERKKKRRRTALLLFDSRSRRRVESGKDRKRSLRRVASETVGAEESSTAVKGTAPTTTDTRQQERFSRLLVPDASP